MCSGLLFVLFIKELLCRPLHSSSDLLHRKGTQKGTQRSATKTYTETTICKAVHINTVIYKTKRTEVSQKVCGSCCTWLVLARSATQL